MLDKEPNSVTQHIYAFRSWWRLFDAVESSISGGVTVAARVENVSDITELHRQRAFDDGMDRLPFSNFLRIINIVRKENRLPQLHWIPQSGLIQRVSALGKFAKFG